MNAAKEAVIDASKPFQTAMAEDIRAHWPTDIILNDHVAQLLGDGANGGSYTPAMRRAMEDVGAVALGAQLKIHNKAQRGWILRNAKRWTDATKEAQRQEILRAGVDSIRSPHAVIADALEVEPAF